jgi:TatD DNase family protein
VETDTPYLAPVPLRGHQCEPAYVVHTAKCIASERKTDIDTFSELTFANSARLFLK